MKALGSGEGSSKKAATAGTIKKEEPAKSIKVEAADVGLLVSKPFTLPSFVLSFVVDDLVEIECGGFVTFC